MPENKIIRTGCPFEWCTEDHGDDWVNDENGNPLRHHTLDLGLWDARPWLNVDELRTVDGVTFSPATVQVSDQQEVPLESYVESLQALLGKCADWKAIVRDVEQMRETL